MSTLTASSPEELIKDRETLAVKDNLMAKMKQGTLYSSISTVAMFVAGPLMAIGASLALATGGTSMMAGLALLGFAATALAVGVTTSYLSSRVWQGSNFDTFEMNARSTAKHLVEQLKENNLCLTSEHEQNCRADGKQWAQVVRQDNTPQVQY